MKGKRANAAQGRPRGRGRGRDRLLGAATNIVAAYVANAALAHQDLPSLIRSVHAVLSEHRHERARAASPKPAVAADQSVFQNHLACLEDGRRLKMLKRHLKAAFGLTPDAYRQKWRLAADYPMVAPAYAKRRSELAKSFGLGTSTRKKAT